MLQKIGGNQNSKRKYRPNDIYIAIMGVTGAGKSTFISKCCQEAVDGIGHTLKSSQSP
jgi:type IV secretory pathway VirB4 component